MKNIQGRNVVLGENVRPHCCNEVVPAGIKGFVRWDEGGEEVIVEFDRDVPNGGLLFDSRQMWIARRLLKVVL